jgi:glycine oxidase
VRALRVAAERAGAEIVAGTGVSRLLVEGGRVAGVLTEDGARHEARRVVVAAGAWSGAIEAAGVAAVPSEPVRGQMIAFREPDLLRRILVGPTCYLVPRSDGRILVGATMERVGYDRRVTAAGLALLSRSAIELLPTLAGSPFDRAWAGLRPAAPDGLPVIGAAALPGLFYACGHLRNGVVLTPITAQALARVVQGSDPGIDLASFSPARFGA